MHLSLNLHHHHLMDTACIDSKHLYYFHFRFFLYDLLQHINPRKEGQHCIYFCIHFHHLNSSIFVNYLHSQFEFSCISLSCRLLVVQLFFIPILIFLSCHSLVIKSFDSFNNLHNSLSFSTHLSNLISSNH